MSDEPRKTSLAFTASKVLTIAALGWLGYMTYITWVVYRAGYLNAVLPVWNVMFTVGIALVAVQLLRHREWARRWMQGAALCTAIMNLLGAIKPGGERYWIGVAVLGLCGWALAAAREDYVDRDDGTPPGPIARMLGVAALIGSVVITVLPSSMLG